MKQKKTRIAVVVPRYGLAGGAEGYAASLTARLARDPSLEIHVFARRWQAQGAAVAFHRVPLLTFPKCLTTPSFAWFVSRKLRAGAFDLVHTHERIFAADLFTMHGIPHRTWIREVRQRRLRLADRTTAWVEKRLVSHPRCRRFLAVSHLVKEAFLAEYPVDPQRVLVVPPGVDARIPPAGPSEEDRRRVRRRFGIPPADTVFVFVSMNFEIKNLDLVLRALGILRRRSLEGFHLVVAGKGSQARYGRLARREGIGERVHFTGVLPREALAGMYRAGDAFVMPSRYDTFGMVVLEAMAAGLPAVVSRHVGAKDLIRQAENGFVVSRDDAEELASVLFLLLDPAIRGRLAREAVETARARSWDAVAAEVSRLYGDLLSDRASGPR